MSCHLVLLVRAFPAHALVHEPSLRQIEGFFGSMFHLMDIQLGVPDLTTLSRHGRQLTVCLQSLPDSGPIDLIVDSTGLAIVGECEWAAAKQGEKGIQGWEKPHIGTDCAGVIVAQILTSSKVDGAMTGVALLFNVAQDIDTVIEDAVYDTRPFYNAATDRQACVVVPPTKTAAETRRRCRAQDKTIRRVNKIGRRKWKKESGYHRQARVENAFFSYKAIIGGRLRARRSDAQAVEAQLACNILSRMTELGRPESISVGL